MSERKNLFNLNDGKGRQERPDRKEQGHVEHRDYGEHIHERVEETDSTKNPPKER